MGGSEAGANLAGCAGSGAGRCEGKLLRDWRTLAEGDDAGLENSQGAEQAASTAQYF
ncbi:hypothetical protein D3C72_1969840 [compost metagenome]